MLDLSGMSEITSSQNAMNDKALNVVIQDLLYHIGITAKYNGFFYTSSALNLTVRQPERLLLITKWLYPDVGKLCHTDWRNVERGIRASVNIAWELRPAQLAAISDEALTAKPGNTQFLSILTAYLRSHGAELVEHNK